MYNWRLYSKVGRFKFASDVNAFSCIFRIRIGHNLCCQFSVLSYQFSCCQNKIHRKLIKILDNEYVSVATRGDASNITGYSEMLRRVQCCHLNSCNRWNAFGYGQSYDVIHVSFFAQSPGVPVICTQKKVAGLNPLPGNGWKLSHNIVPG